MAEEHGVNVDNEIQLTVVDDDQVTTAQEISTDDDGVIPSESNNPEWLTDLIHGNNDNNPSEEESGYLYRCHLKFEGHLDGLPKKMTACFIKHLSEETGEDLFQVLISESNDLLKFRYHEREYDGYGDEDVMKYLFLSGCTILMLIESYTYHSLEKLYGISHGEARKIQEYLFNFENQIPFRVVQLLVNMTKHPHHLKEKIVKFIHTNSIIKDLPIPSTNKNSGMTLDNNIIDAINGSRYDKHPFLLHLLYLLITSSDGNIINTNNDRPYYGWGVCLEGTEKDPKEFFRNVEELTSTGIELEPSSSGLATISFSAKCFNLKGHLKLPSLIVDEWTEEKLKNLLRYEMFIKENKLISYIKFMDILIDVEQDVKQLRASRVLQNRLSSDADVANLFNGLGSKFSEPQDDFYRDVKKKIQKHCERKCAIWMTQVYHKYFSTPWAMIGLMAAVIVLSLAAVQAWYAINPKK
ncbi:uncharacterized protein LOC133031542 [Cannabis sativa]|uniref:uncharacterized protein LOC133031542 n=1 Tax=Cannabis sativa TaxID=3483 RepID=UPI0029CA244F|nr:uncharacterized protein LOC133031542 [Cannabis sativa]